MTMDIADVAMGRRGRSGLALATAVMLSACLTIIVASAFLQTVGELKVSSTELHYERALHVAEAGANAYISRLTFGDAAYACLPPLHQYAGGVAPSLSEFKVGVDSGAYTLVPYPAGSDEGYYVGTMGRPGKTAIIVAFGWSDGIVRSVTLRAGQVLAPSEIDGVTTVTPPGDYVFYPITSFTAQNNVIVSGHAGTNGSITIQNNVVFINGTLDLNGPNATLTHQNHCGFTKVVNPDPVDWPTVDEIALKLFPNAGATAPGGLVHLATHNDNTDIVRNGTSGSPATTLNLDNNKTVRFPSKPGGSNYYLTSATFQNKVAVTLDNSNGPITIWFGPSGGAGGWTGQNNVTWTKTTDDDVNKPVTFYFGTQAALIGQNNFSCNVGLYAYNKVNGSPIGAMEIQNNLGFHGSCVANTIVAQNNASFGNEYFKPRGAYYYKRLFWGE
ncbi:MAG: hypothetical protein NT029_19855 [Armatimonadetes bacterium]|nr:hypothetical protein [Armatimonadota bacterium]